MDSRTVLIQDGTHDGQTQAGAGPVARIYAAVERIKDVGQVFGRDAEAVVMHLHPHKASFRRETHDRLPASGAIFDRVVEQVEKDLA